MQQSNGGRHRKPSLQRLPWWGHVIVLSFIAAGTGASVATGNPLYAWVLNPSGAAVGAAIIRGTRVHLGRALVATTCTALVAVAYLLVLALRGHGPDAADIGGAFVFGPIILLIVASIGGQVGRIQRPRHAAVAR